MRGFFDRSFLISSTRLHILKKTRDTLLAVCHSPEHAKQEAQWLLQKLLCCSSLDLLLEGHTVFPKELYPALEAALQARIQAHQPFSRQFQERFFWKDVFLLNNSTLDPRLETESLVDTVLQTLYAQKKENVHILDLGTGSGCIILSLLKEWPHAWGCGIDISSHALEMAKQNALRLGLSDRCQWHQSHWFQNVEGAFDIIVSNPPYIAEVNKAHLPPEVALWDPEHALFGGNDGLLCYRLLASQFTNYLTPNGCVFLEIGDDQAEAVCALLQPFFNHVHVVKDLFGKERIVCANQPKN